MSTCIVDTHVLLWFLTGDSRLSSSARKIIEAPRNVLLVSVASLWEIAIKRAKGHLIAPHDLPAILGERGFELLAIRPEHAWRVADLPLQDHRDPFDRMLAAQALIEGLPLITTDVAFDAYGVDRRW
jgi:PIN domain nuclease of toxin-antitoxin system